MLTNEKPLKIGIPSNSPFDMFLKVEEDQIEPQKKYTGFCFDIFWEVLKILSKIILYPTSSTIYGNI